MPYADWKPSVTRLCSSSRPRGPEIVTTPSARAARTIVSQIAAVGSGPASVTPEARMKSPSVIASLRIRARAAAGAIRSMSRLTSSDLPSTNSRGIEARRGEYLAGHVARRLTGEVQDDRHHSVRGLGGWIVLAAAVDAAARGDAVDSNSVGLELLGRGRHEGLDEGLRRAVRDVRGRPLRRWAGGADDDAAPPARAHV